MSQNKILIVDDDMDVIYIISTILKHEGFVTEYATNKKDALVKARIFKPDLAILDVIMNTHYEGFELARDFRQDPGLKDMPVIIQTSIEVFSTNLRSEADMAFEYRKDPAYKELQVVLMRDLVTGTAGIDYRSDTGKSEWVPVSGFLKKPVEASRLLPEIHRVLHMAEV